jgi:hypothetical protein
MEYGMIEGRSIEHLVAILNVQAGDGWELAGTPVVETRAHGGGSSWFAIVRKDGEGSALRAKTFAALETYTRLCAELERERRELELLRQQAAALLTAARKH